MLLLFWTFAWHLGNPIFSQCNGPTAFEITDFSGSNLSYSYVFSQETANNQITISINGFIISYIPITYIAGDGVYTFPYPLANGDEVVVTAITYCENNNETSEISIVLQYIGGIATVEEVYTPFSETYAIDYLSNLGRKCRILKDNTNKILYDKPKLATIWKDMPNKDTLKLSDVVTACGCRVLANTVPCSTSKNLVANQEANILRSYPNPATDELIFYFNEAIDLNASIQIYGIDGKLWLAKDSYVIDGMGIINVDELPSGIYHLVLSESTKDHYLKFVKK